MASVERRLEELEAQADRLPPGDPRFEVHPRDRQAWPDIPPDEKQHLWEIFQRCGPVGIPPYRAPVWLWHGRWQVIQLATRFGRARYCFTQTWQEQGDEEFAEWIAAHATDEEYAAIDRMEASGWDPEVLRDGDAARLEAMIPRLPRRPSSRELWEGHA